MIETVCQRCEEKFKVDDGHAGKLIRCPLCRAPVRVDGPIAAEVIDERSKGRRALALAIQIVLVVGVCVVLAVATYALTKSW